MTDKEVLIEALSLLEKGICRLTQARDAEGNPVEPYGDKAVSFCSSGALQRVYTLNDIPLSQQIRINLKLKGEHGSIPHWHDHSPDEVVLSHWSQVIKETAT